MQYLLFVGTAPDGNTIDEAEAAKDPRYMEIDDWVDTMDGAGKRIIGERLRPPRDATTVRVRGGELLVTDGPFAEGKEYIAGFDIIEAADLDEAIDIASKHPMAHMGLIEIHPTWPWEG